MRRCSEEVFQRLFSGTRKIRQKASVLWCLRAVLREMEQEARQQWEDMPLEAHMEHYMSQGIDKKEAMKLVAKDRGHQ